MPVFADLLSVVLYTVLFDLIFASPKPASVVRVMALIGKIDLQAVPIELCSYENH